VFVDQTDAALYEAIRGAVSGLGLADATRAIEEGGVIHSTTGLAVDWHTPLMILPVNEALRNRLADPDGEAEKLPQLELAHSR
jgi:hypothetical protein